MTEKATNTEAPDEYQGPLSGIRVLDFGRYIAGPFCAALLAEFGADVIRVEHPRGGEDRFLMPITATGTGAMFLQMNRNKRSLAIKPDSAHGREAIRRLIASADIVVANLPPPTLRKLGIDYASLSAIRSDIILVHVTAYGSQGPWQNYPGFDGSGQAMCGGAYLTGEPGQPPRRSQVSWVDQMTATNAAFGAMLALWERQRSGQGQEVQGSLLNTALSANAPILVEEAAANRQREPCGNRSYASTPSNFFETRDGGWLVLTTIGQAQFARIAEATGHPEWLNNPRYATDESRVQNEAELHGPLAEWCLQQNRDELVDHLCAMGIPAAPVLSPHEALEHPQILASGQLREMPLPGIPESVSLMAAPVQLLDTPGRLRRPPPDIGEHNEEILTELGLQ